MLAGTAGAFLGATALPRFALAQSEAPISAQAFLALSERLTMRQSLSPVIASRALECLSAEDPAFPAKAAELDVAAAEAGLTDMADFAAFAESHPDLQPVAMKIISAWYLGYTGKAEGESTVDTACFVTYAGALMYEPTIDATVIPSYSRGATNYWAEPPATIAND